MNGQKGAANASDKEFIGFKCPWICEDALGCSVGLVQDSWLRLDKQLDSIDLHLIVS